MTIFEAVKTTVAPRTAAEHFGLSVSRNRDGLLSLS